MKLKEILSNFVLSEDRSISIMAEDAYEILKNTDSDIKKETPKVYRGKQDDQPILKINPSEFTRRSANTTNHYTFWIDNRWPDKYPDRSKSIVCSKDRSVAEHYGDSYVIIPYEDHTFGVCPSYDMWHSFSELEKYRADPGSMFNVNLSHFLEQKTNGKIEKITDSSYSEMLEQIRILNDLTDEEWEEYAERAERDAFLEAYRSTAKDVKNYNDVVDFLDDVLDPEKNGFETKRYTEISSGNEEVWTSGRCLMIKTEWFDKVFEGDL